MGKQWKQHQTLFFGCLCKETQPVHSKGDQSWVFFGSNYAKAEGPILWPLHATSWFIGKDSDAGRDWGQEEKGTTRGWHGWMASLTRWTWVWVNSSSWWWTWRPGMLRFMGSQWVGRDWATELSWIQFLQPQKRKKTKVTFQKTEEWFCSFYEWFIKWFGGLHTIMMIFSHQEADDNICYLNTRDRKELNLWFFLVPDFQIITKVILVYITRKSFPILMKRVLLQCSS